MNQKLRNYYHPSKCPHNNVIALYEWGNLTPTVKSVSPTSDSRHRPPAEWPQPRGRQVSKQVEKTPPAHPHPRTSRAHLLRGLPNFWVVLDSWPAPPVLTPPADCPVSLPSVTAWARPGRRTSYSWEEGTARGPLAGAWAEDGATWGRCPGCGSALTAQRCGESHRPGRVQKETWSDHLTPRRSATITTR